MKSVLTILILLVFCHETAQLRTSTDPPQPTYSDPNYEKQLNNVQNKLSTQIDQLKSQISEVDGIVKDASKSTGVKITSLTEKLADERNQLYDIEQSLNIPYQLKTCECVDLTSQQKSALQSKSTDINNKIAGLQQQLNSCSENNCKYLDQQVKSMKIYMNQLNNIVNSNCCRQKFVFKQEKPVGVVDMSNYLYKDNLKANNWFFAVPTSQQNYKLKNFELTTKYNMKTCPLKNPYVNIQSNKCQQCNGTYDLGDRKCYICGKLQYFDTKNVKCQKCPQFQYYDPNKKKCLLCDHDQYLNPQTQKCQDCQTDQFFDSASGTCKACPDNSQYDRTKRTCRPCNLTGGQFLNKITKKCENCPYRLFYNVNTNKCQRCQGKNEYFQKTKGSCVECPNPLIINPVTMNCQQCGSGTFFIASKKGCFRCPAGYKYESSKQHCVKIASTCPSNTPRFNIQTNQCQACRPGTYYSPHANECVNHIADCPPGKPFFNIKLNQCVPCPQGTKYNSSKYICQGGSSHQLTQQN